MQKTSTHNYIFRYFIPVIAVLCVLAIVSWVNYLYVKDHSGGRDFYIHWMATRQFFIEGIDPYSDEASERFQEFNEERDLELTDGEMQFVSPLYSVIFYLPFLFISDFSVARALWMTLLELSIVIQAFICMKIVRWKPVKITMILFYLFVLFNLHTIMALLDGNFIILVSLFIAGGLLSIKEGGDELAGVLFAFSVIKVHAIVLFVIFVFYWATRRNR